MRQPNTRRGRGRGNGRRPGPGRPQNFDSSGPNVKIRGTAAQVLEKYLALARDATSSGDRITAENYYQHAEHYYRVLNANGATPERDANRNNAGANATGNGAGQGEQPDVPQTIPGEGEQPSAEPVTAKQSSAEPPAGEAVVEKAAPAEASDGNGKAENSDASEKEQPLV